MLRIKNIYKTYMTGDIKQNALNGVNISFRENEFVSVLGPSGSGKTTLLNIIGGLDRCTSGDLVINGVSTKEYTDADWDYYRNNSIGFVFQSYNLIPHQSVLSNVEIALTLAGVSKKERKSRAIAVLKKVGLGDHVHKKPNQLSGGQMQRVAIARALINDPDILLADEPTGALDSETSQQILDLLKEVAKDKLVIMVTHNGELAEKYSTRIVELLDGMVVSDSDPYAEEEIKTEKRKHKKISMSFKTALSLSFSNLNTKKGRTLLTSFAGSIGIIGIALIFALSTGMNAYIADIQKETMASYPIVINDETIDISKIMGMRGELIGKIKDKDAQTEKPEAVVADYTPLNPNEMISSNIVKNNLTGFKRYLDSPECEIRRYIGENGIVYTYNVNFGIYSRDADGKLINSDSEVKENSHSGNNGGLLRKLDASFVFGEGFSSGASNFSELMKGSNGKTVSSMITDNYDMVYGEWPEEYDEIILVLGRDNGISAETLCQMGFITKEQYKSSEDKIKKGGEAEETLLEYADICAHKFYLVPACDHYRENADGVFTLIDDNIQNEEELLKKAVELKITGIVRPKEGSKNTGISTAAAYTSKLTDYIITYTDESAVVKAQEKNPAVNALTGMNFEAADEETKISDAKAYLSALSISEKAAFYQFLMYYSSLNPDNAGATALPSQSPEANTPLPETAVPADGAGVTTASPADGTAVPTNIPTGMPTGMPTGFPQDMPAGIPQGQGMPTDEASMAAALDMMLNSNPDKELLLRVYDEYIAGATYKSNMEDFGKVSYDSPASINIYTDSFENKDEIAACIKRYNETAAENEQITYTDYVAMAISAVTTIIDGISYVLIAFVAISLIVSCLMIGIITHISVMERTKEIGILRALGASKRNISLVFNAETFIVGCCAGILGIGISFVMLIPMNIIIEKISGLAGLRAQLPVLAAAVLVVISIIITILGGLLPAKSAAKKDPVIALRTE